MKIYELCKNEKFIVEWCIIYFRIFSNFVYYNFGEIW